jgi:hypothetical protein
MPTQKFQQRSLVGLDDKYRCEGMQHGGEEGVCVPARRRQLTQGERKKRLSSLKEMLCHSRCGVKFLHRNSSRSSRSRSSSRATCRVRFAGGSGAFSDSGATSGSGHLSGDEGGAVSVWRVSPGDAEASNVSICSKYTHSEITIYNLYTHSKTRTYGPLVERTHLFN